MQKTTIISASEIEIAEAFTEWDRRYRDDPESFVSEASRLLHSTPQSYGEACAPYFIEILADLSLPATLPPPKPRTAGHQEREQIEPRQRFTFIGEGCFRDALQPGWEFTPTLNSTSKPQAECERLARECTLLGGGWELPDDPMLLARLVRYDHHNPATFPELAADTRSDWYWTRKRTAWSSGRVWFVSFLSGRVLNGYPVSGGFARGVRRVPVSPGQ